MIDLDDKTIRKVVKSSLEKNKYYIIEELGIDHGAVRADVVAISEGFMHGYEIKSDKDNLMRLNHQINAYNKVFDKITLVVGKKHIIECISIVPEWWGIQLATEEDNNIRIYNIRTPKKHKEQSSVSIARLLWRQEALDILKEQEHDKGVRSKPREYIYERMSHTLEQQEIKNKAISAFRFRNDWRSAVQSA